MAAVRLHGVCPGHDEHVIAGLWLAGHKNKRLGWDVEATCERVYQQGRYPSKQLLRSIHDLHSVPHACLLEWFALRRKQDSATRFQS